MDATLFITSALLWSGLLYAAAKLLATQAEPKFQQLVWRAAALLMVLPLVVQLTVPALPSGIDPTPISSLPLWLESDSGAAPLALAEASTQTSWIPSLNAILIGILILGWSWRLTAWLMSQRSLQALKRSARPAQAFELASNRSALPVKITDRRHSPFIAGWVRPAIYLPAGLEDQSLLRAIIAHEETHYRRGDLVTSPVERLIGDIFWFSPFAHFTASALEQTREEVCDQLTAEELGNRKSYAQALLAVARDFRPGRHPAPSFIPNRKESLAMRIQRIVRPNTKPSTRRSIAAALLGACLLPAALAQGLSEQANASIFEHPLFMEASARITSEFGVRIDPINKKEKLHTGIDIGGLDIGTDIHAPAAGRVRFTGKKKGYGKTVEIELENGHVLRFGQLNAWSVSVDDQVEAGDVIGQLGSSGRSTGPHLHFEYLDVTSSDENIPLDPLTMTNLKIKP